MASTTMTLSIALITHKLCVTATDRRITAGRLLVSDEHDKMADFWTDDAKAVISFSGVAKAYAFDTHKWLIQTLPAVGSPDFSLAGVMTRLRDAATETFRTNPDLLRVPQASRRLSIMVAGYKWGRAAPKPIYGVLSNFERPDLRCPPALTASPEFHLSVGHLRPEEECVTVVIGDTSHVDADRVVRLRNRAQLLGARALSLQLVDVVRRAAFAGRSLATVGRQITTAVLDPDPASPSRSHYYSGIVQRTAFMPAVVFCQRHSQVAITDIRIEAKSPHKSVLAVPVVGRNKRCPCKSGLKYKQCHGRRA